MPNTREKLIDLMTAFYGVDPMYYGVEAHHLADHLIANGVTVQKWIPVTERLPNAMEWVLCATTYKTIHILRYDHIMDDWDALGNANRCYEKTFVTHWMELPEPPKGE